MSELTSLANLLAGKTMQNKIVWTVEADAGLNTVQGDSFIEVRRHRFDEPQTIELTIRNKDGFVLAQEWFEQGEDGYLALNGLMVATLRRSLKVDEALSDLQTRLRAL